MMPNFLSLRGRLLVSGLLAVLPVLGIIIYSGVEQSRQLSSAAETDLLSAGRLAAKEQSRAVVAARELLVALSKLPAVRDPARTRECNATLTDLLSHQDHYVNFGVIARDGSVRCSGLPLEHPVNLADRSYFRTASMSKGFAIGEYQVGRITKRSSVNVAYPVYDRSHQVTAVVYAALDLGWITDLVSASLHTPGAVGLLVDQNGTILSRYPDPSKWIGATVSDSKGLRSVLRTPREGVANAVGLDGVARLYAHLPLGLGSDHGVAFLVGIPEATVYAAMQRRTLRDVVLVVGLAILVAVVLWWGGGILVLKPIQALAGAAGRLGRGDLAARTDLKHDSDELGHLALAFDTMAQGLEQRDANIAKVNRALRTLSAGNRTLLHESDETSLLEGMCRVTVDVGGYPMAWIGRAIRDANKTVRLVAQAGAEHGFLEQQEFSWANTPDQRSVLGAAASRRRHQVVVDLAQVPDAAPWQEAIATLGLRSTVVLPLLVEDELWGLFSVYAREPDAFGDDEVRILAEMVDDLAFGMRTLRVKDRHAEADAALQHLAYYDALTDLPNRVLLLNILEECITDCHEKMIPLAVLVLDLNRFGEINDILGYEPGDAVLTMIGPRLRAALPKNIMIGRIGADEFGVVLSGYDAREARRAAVAIERALAVPFPITDLLLDIRATVGIALYPEHGDDAERLLRYAAKAVTQTRRLGDNHGVYTPESTEISRRRLVLGSQLHRAVTNDELFLHYQPKVDFADGRPCGAEALVRWHHPDEGVIPPGEFVPLAEYIGVIKPMTYWAVEASLRQSNFWRRKNTVSLPIAVNLSAFNLRDSNLANRIDGLLQTWDIAPDGLELELTESALMEDPERALRMLKDLHEMGLRLFVDDFGTGYSSLSYLQKLPVDAIKIDKSFVIRMAVEPESLSIVRSTIDLAHNLGIKVVAEGVETREAWNTLRSLGCDVAQGFGITKPLPPEEFESWALDKIRRPVHFA